MALIAKSGRQKYLFTSLRFLLKTIYIYDAKTTKDWSELLYAEKLQRRFHYHIILKTTSIKLWAIASIKYIRIIIKYISLYVIII